MNTLPCNEKHEIDAAIINLEKLGNALSMWADNNDNTNSELAHMFSMMALEMRSQASTLKGTQSCWGIL
jgi:hypothetical protein